MLDMLFGTSTIQHPVTIAIFDTTSSGGVHCEHLHLHKVLGLPLPPPNVNQYNMPRLRLYTGLRHGPWASNLHQLTILTCGSRHQPQAPDQTFGFHLVETLDLGDDDSALVYNVLIHACFYLMMTMNTVLFFCLALSLFDFLLGILQFHLVEPYEIVGG